MGEALSAEAVLVACPVCKAWPMVVRTRESWFSQLTLTFICSKCQFKEVDNNLQKGRPGPFLAR